MKAASANILSIKKGPKQFVIPIYQWTYSWLQSQYEQLFQEFIQVSNHQHALGESQGHFLGSVAYFQKSIHIVSDIQRLWVIDRQQCLTTISLLTTAFIQLDTKNREVA